MKLRHLLSAFLLCWAGMAGARDVHGVNGYYNWTTAQMQTSANLAFGRGISLRTGSLVVFSMEII